MNDAPTPEMTRSRSVVIVGNVVQLGMPSQRPPCSCGHIHSCAVRNCRNQFVTGGNEFHPCLAWHFFPATTSSCAYLVEEVLHASVRFRATSLPFAPRWSLCIHRRFELQPVHGVQAERLQRRLVQFSALTLIFTGTRTGRTSSTCSGPSVAAMRTTTRRRNCERTATTMTSSSWSRSDRGPASPARSALTTLRGHRPQRSYPTPHTVE